jgi:hypothetical protein
VSDGAEDWHDEGAVGWQAPVQPAVPPRREKPASASSFTDDPLTRLWQGVEDRETGAEAVEAMRKRKREERKRSRRRRG